MRKELDKCFILFSGKGSKKKAKNSNKNKKPRPYVKEITNCQAFSHICSGYFKVCNSELFYFSLLCSFVLNSYVCIFVSLFLLSLSFYWLVLSNFGLKSNISSFFLFLCAFMVWFEVLQFHSSFELNVGIPNKLQFYIQPPILLLVIGSIKEAKENLVTRPQL